ASVLPWIIVGVLSAGLGSAVPFLLPSGDTKAVEEEPPKPEVAFEMPPEEETVFLPFLGDKETDIVVNLNDGRLTRFLTVSITLQIPKSQEEEIKKRLTDKKIVLRNWLLSHISDKALDEIRGGSGQNRMRREIRDEFNSVLCPDGIDYIYDILFERFAVQ
ncbi:MAG: flagellar basal body-associated FliL family protein, partial [Planctomycetaceae bacterium]|nr:flagellar basal body-associated FliL family protein [Planctomycetaceae bacterium]